MSVPDSRDSHQRDHEPAHRWPGFSSCDGTDQTPAWVTEKEPDIRAALCLDTPADPTGATRARREFDRWLGIDVEDPHARDIVLAVYEAVANAAEHAYADRPGGPGRVWLTAHRGPDHVRIAVADWGQWRPATGARFRGRGLELMRALMSQVHLLSDPHGTVVQLRSVVTPGPRTETA